MAQTARRIEYRPTHPSRAADEWCRPAVQSYRTSFDTKEWIAHQSTPALLISKVALKIIASPEPLPINQKKFDRLVMEWKAAAAKHSSVARIAMHPSYQYMIGMGAVALPFIFERLKSEQNEPDHWFWALAAISEENPVPKESRGRIAEMSKAWLEWGKEQGYVRLD